MWTFLVFLNLWALLCTASTSLPSPTNVSFSSVNLRNVLHWLPGNGTPDDTHFTVEYAIYGDSTESSKGRRANWRAVRQCREIVRMWCDLSRETEDEEQGYYARVRAVSRKASSKWSLTRRRFDPKLDTSFGPPLVYVEIVNNSAIITLKGPMRYQPKTNTSTLSMAAIYPQMSYNLSINNTHHNRIDSFPVYISPYKYHLMDYNTQYCFSARSRFLSMLNQCHSSAWHCVTTPQDPVIMQLKQVIVGIVVPALCIGVIGVVGYILYQYLTGEGQKSPYILNLFSFHSAPVTFPPEKLDPMSISEIKEEPFSHPAYSKLHLNTPSPPQWPRALPEHEEPLDLLGDYGFVAEADKMNTGGEEEAKERSPKEGDDGKDEHQRCKAGERKELRVEVGHSAGCSCCQENCCQKNQMHITMSTFEQTCEGSQTNPVSITSTLGPSESFQGFKVTVRGEQMNRKIRVSTYREEKMDEGLTTGGKPESVPLLSTYSSQNMPNFFSDQSDNLPDDYGFLSAAVTEKTEKDGEVEEEEQGGIFVNWDPQTRKLMLPDTEIGYKKKGGFHGGTGREAEEEPYVTNGELKLENVFVRQGSEEQAEIQRQLERGGGTGMGMGDVFSRWNVVVCVDE